jgi:hypothetical protein
MKPLKTVPWTVFIGKSKKPVHTTMARQPGKNTYPPSSLP